ncbi:TPA: hypothetical protein ACLA7N_001563, partial [Neisseria meningitidis]
EQENITFATDIKKPLSLGCQRGMLRKVMRPFDRAHHIRRESRPVRTETYRIKTVAQTPRSRFPLPWE